jgi:hypothetical protein
LIDEQTSAHILICADGRKRGGMAVRLRHGRFPTGFHHPMGQKPAVGRADALDDESGAMTGFWVK